jgi:hypothetical protein
MGIILISVLCLLCRAGVMGAMRKLFRQEHVVAVTEETSVPVHVQYVAQQAAGMHQAQGPGPGHHQAQKAQHLQPQAGGPQQQGWHYSSGMYHQAAPDVPQQPGADVYQQQHAWRTNQQASSQGAAGLYGMSSQPGPAPGVPAASHPQQAYNRPAAPPSNDLLSSIHSSLSSIAAALQSQQAQQYQNQPGSFYPASQAHMHMAPPGPVPYPAAPASGQPAFGAQMPWPSSTATTQQVPIGQMPGQNLYQVHSSSGSSAPVAGPQLHASFPGPSYLPGPAVASSGTADSGSTMLHRPQPELITALLGPDSVAWHLIIDIMALMRHISLAASKVGRASVCNIKVLL